jgi:hypothetical protein
MSHDYAIQVLQDHRRALRNDTDATNFQQFSVKSNELTDAIDTLANDE